LAVKSTIFLNLIFKKYFKIFKVLVTRMCRVSDRERERESVCIFVYTTFQSIEKLVPRFTVYLVNTKAPIK